MSRGAGPRLRGPPGGRPRPSRFRAPPAAVGAPPPGAGGRQRVKGAGGSLRAHGQAALAGGRAGGSRGFCLVRAAASVGCVRWPAVVGGRASSLSDSLRFTTAWSSALGAE
uniref:Uncharacterized protein n=1 Tax=Heterosigma akashiwo TaxID=2829 RepID=A0A6V1WJS9_HETAK|mmetsp:Transcript_23675/g.32764  ORF Transcript_23675/g.32764 Transcript_23675/m.32764 type:complete len:111 (-) Transcript_23675:47-379(-)